MADGRQIGNGFVEHRLLILENLKDAKEERAEIRTQLRAIEKEVTTMKVKVTIYAGAAGVVAGAIVSGVVGLLMGA